MIGVDNLYHIVYRTTNTINGKYYIGVHNTKNLEDGYLGSGVTLQKALKKYGPENFKREILSFHENSEAAYKRESELVTLKECRDHNCYNCFPGGCGCRHAKKLKEESIQKMRDSLRLYYRTHTSPNIGRKHSSKTLQKQSDAKRGPKNPMYGKHHTEEVKKRISAAHSGPKARFWGQHSPTAKVLHQYTITGELIKRFECVEDAVNETGLIKAWWVSEHLRTGPKSKHGFIWSYEEYTDPNQLIKDASINRKKGYPQREILQCLGDKIIAEHASVTEAEKTGLISQYLIRKHVTHDKQYIHNGYGWMYKYQEIY